MKSLDEIKDLIREGELTQVTKELKVVIENSSFKQEDLAIFDKELIMFSSRLATVERNASLGMTSDQDTSAARLRIINGLLDILDRIDSKLLANNPKVNPVENNFKEACFHKFPTVKISDCYIPLYFDFDETYRAKIVEVVDQIKREKAKSKLKEIEGKHIHELVFQHFLKGDLVPEGKENPRLLVIEGWPGHGKTMLCKKIINELDKRLYDASYFDMELAPNSKKIIDDPSGQLINFQKTPNGRIKVLIFDGFSEIRGAEEGFISNALEDIALKLGKIDAYGVITVRANTFNSSCLDFDNGIGVIRLKEWDLKSQQEFCNKLLKKEKKEVEDTHKMLSLGFLDDNILGIPAVAELYYWILLYGDTNTSKDAFKLFCKELFRRFWKKRQVHSIKRVDPEEFVDWFKRIAKYIRYTKKGAPCSIAELADKDSNVVTADLKKSFSSELDSAQMLKHIISAFPIKSVYNIRNHQDDFGIVFWNKEIEEWFFVEWFMEDLLNCDLEYVGRPDPLEDEAIGKRRRKKAHANIHIIWTHFIDNSFSESLIGKIVAQLASGIHDGEAIYTLKEKLKSTLPDFLKYQLLYRYEIREASYPPISRCLDGFYYFWKFLKSLSPKEDFILGDKAATVDFIKLVRLDKIINKERSYDFSYQCFDYPDFTGITFQGDSFRGTEFDSVDFSNTRLGEVDFSNAVFVKANFSQAKLTKCSFRGAALNEADFTFSIGNAIDFTNAEMIDTVIEKCEWKEIDFTETMLSGSSFMESAIYGLKLHFAKSLEGVNFTRTTMSFVGLRNEHEERFLRILRNVHSLYGARFSPRLMDAILLEKRGDEYVNKQLFYDPENDVATEFNEFSEDPYDKDYYTADIPDSRNLPINESLYRRKKEIEKIMKDKTEELRGILTFYEHNELVEFINPLLEELKKSISSGNSEQENVSNLQATPSDPSSSEAHFGS